MSEQQCPCGQQAPYEKCCQPLHQGVHHAADAQQLMRSRYCAFVKQEVDYIIKTTALKQQSLLDRDSLMQWSQQTEWLYLDIIDFQPQLDKTHASVEFKAFYQSGANQASHHEQSYFVKHQNKWYFIDPTVEQVLTLKQPCLCGGAKKFKHCCALYL